MVSLELAQSLATMHSMTLNLAASFFAFGACKRLQPKHSNAFARIGDDQLVSQWCIKTDLPKTDLPKTDA